MRRKTKQALLASGMAIALVTSAPLLAQKRGEKKAPVEVCQDEAGMVADYRKRLEDVSLQVRQESLENFQKAYHQKSCQTMLTLYVGILDSALACLDKATKDETAPKRERDSYKAKLESSTALKTKVTHYRDELKAAKTSAAAKALIEKFDLAQ